MIINAKNWKELVLVNHNKTDTQIIKNSSVK